MTIRRLHFSALAGAVALAATTAAVTAENGEPPTFAEAQIYIELNHTDGDLGLHALIDGEPWRELEIEGPRDVTLLDVLVRGGLRRQGLTEIFFESAEPPFDELPPATFFRRFPEGRYEIEGVSLDGREFESTDTLSHVLAAPPDGVLVGGARAAENCDATPLPRVSPPVVIDWDPVTTSHPELGRRGRVRIAMYQLFVERAGVKLGIDLPPSVTQFEIPTSITRMGRDFKFEIIARTTTGNNTAIESCFIVQNGGGS
jgi:hypothetical protein